MNAKEKVANDWICVEDNDLGNNDHHDVVTECA